MATLYKPTIITYRLKDGSYRTPDGKRVTKHTPGARKEKTKSKKWYGRYTDGAGRPMRVPLAESKEIARRMLAKLSGDSQMAGVGLADPFEEHRGRPLAEHVEDFRRFLLAKGNTAKHVALHCSRVNAVWSGCRFEMLDDLQASPVIEFLATLRSPGALVELNPAKKEYTKPEALAVLSIHQGSLSRMMRRLQLKAEGQGKARRYSAELVKDLQKRIRRGASVATYNHYLVAVKGFTRWLARDRRIGADPLAHLTRQNPETDVRHPRRALKEDAFNRFVEATGIGKPFRGLAGADRLVLYTLAANTGFRASELGSLTPAAFRLDGQPPTVAVDAAYSKRRRKDTQPLRADVAEMMRRYITGKPRKELLWPGTWTEVAAEMLRHDLAAAGIPYEDEDGRYFDFHAMRGQFISFLAASGVHPKVAQELARHSTITLTMDYYTHLDVLDVAGALEKLPPVAPRSDQTIGRKERKGKGEARHA